MNMLNRLTKYEFTKTLISASPEEPGVYIFYDIKNKVIYIGKAKSLKTRLKSYLGNNIIGKTDKLVKNIRSFSYIKVISELEAILLESNLIKKYKPYYNISLKDDKSNIYVFITNEKFPRLLIGRKSQLKYIYKYSFGPFINSTTFRSILKMLRNIIPYSTHTPMVKPCLYYQLGLCNPCPSVIESSGINKKILSSLYKSNIKSLIKFFNGKFSLIEKELFEKMLLHSSKQEFEQANLYKQKLKYLKYLLTPPDTVEMYTDDPYYANVVKKNELKEIESILYKHINIKIKLKRIECYDISHLHGSSSTGSMVTFTNSSPDKKYYRHFKLNIPQNNDVSSLKEIALRRIKHFKDWGRSDLIVVDGGRAQANQFNKLFKRYNIPVVGISKRFEELIIPLKDNKYAKVKLSGNALHLIQRLRDEAHRFAQRYHHHLMNRNLLKTDRIKYK